MTLASTDRRPRCGMPITMSLTPNEPPRLMICSIAGIRLSPPSRPKRLVPMYLTCRNFSKPSASTILFRIALRPSRLNWISLPKPSIRSLSQPASSGFEMCMYCSAKVPQYVRFTIERISRMVAICRPSTLSMKIGRSMSASVKPYDFGSSSGCGVVERMPNGSKSATR